MTIVVYGALLFAVMVVAIALLDALIPGRLERVLGPGAGDDPEAQPR